MLKKRCQAKNPAACVDPYCPEKMYLKNAFSKALENGDFNAYLEAREQEADLEPYRVIRGQAVKEWDRLIVKRKSNGDILRVSIPQTATILFPFPLTEVQSYDSYGDIEKAFSEKTLGSVGKEIILELSNNKHLSYIAEDDPLPGFLLTEFYVSSKLRGQGVGEHIMRTLTQHADEQNLVIELVPTEAGDGTSMDGDVGHKEKAIAHKERLTKFYERHGFTLNPFYHYADRSDYLTGEPHQIDYAARKKFTKAGADILRNHSMYIRFPHNEIPAQYLA
jgi:GNAT superfamily N-acetyltransferase